MIGKVGVFARKAGEKVGRVVYHGELEECEKYAGERVADFEYVTIVDDDGRILEKVK